MSTAHRVLRPFLSSGSITQAEPPTAPIDELSKQLHDACEENRESAKHNLLWKLMGTYIPAEKGSVQVAFVNHIELTIARSRFNFDNFSSYLACSYSVRDRLIELFNDTMEYFITNRVKQVYYVSIEFLLGRFLRNALLNLELEDIYRQSLEELDVSLDSLYNEEYDPGLGNGGLGRLAACFLDSLATMNYPGWGYGLMYSFGMFKQTIAPDGSQMEIPDYWLSFGDPWRVQKTVTHPIHFYGIVENGVWKPSLTIMAVASDFLIPGFATDNTLALRLWSSKPTSELDEAKFRFGDYYEALEMKQRCENLTSVLYPNDNTPEGKEMRLMQEYFLSSATIQDIIRRLKTQQKCPITELANYAAIQLNDTHPTIMIVELMRILLDEEHLDFNSSLKICRDVFGYTCHTLMPEALEKWPVQLFESILPRHLEIIYAINQAIMDELNGRADLSSISIIEESNPKMVRMANLAVIGSHSVNGVAKIHTELMKDFVFKPFFDVWPQKFSNKTNGVTVRRWLHHCNQGLRTLITEVVGDENWPLHTELLIKLMEKLGDESFCERWEAVKLANKIRLADYVKKTVGIELNPEKQMFDVQVKRIHEYKRQSLNIIGVIDRYMQILESSAEELSQMVPRAVIFGGKAAPGYFAAKKLIKLINAVANIVNNDPYVGDLLKVVFLPNYNVSSAEIIISAADLSQHISTAGTEASGTSNMKFAFNGSLIIGTKDGATIEIADAIGEENVFFFGATTDEVQSIRKSERKELSPRLERVFTAIRSGTFGEPGEYETVLSPIEEGDYYLVAHDFEAYLRCQEQVDAAFLDKRGWQQKSIMSCANMGFFSSDRTIKEYADEIWHIKPCPLPQVVQTSFEIPAIVPVPQAAIGSVGSIRRHSVDASTLTDGSYSKGGYGSLRRGREPLISAPPPSKKKKEVEEEGAIAIDF